MAERWKTVLLASAICACNTGPEVVVEPGRLEFDGQAAMIDVPSTAAVGEDVRVVVTTYGGGCIGFERTEVKLTPTGADFRPFDHRVIPDGDGKCTQILRFIPHKATLVFGTPGSKTITIYGRRVQGLGYEEISIDAVVSLQ